jgi:hypothetical protein
VLDIGETICFESVGESGLYCIVAFAVVDDCVAFGAVNETFDELLCAACDYEKWM